MFQYTVRTTKEGYRVVKFDTLYNVEAIYYVTRGGCSCPRGRLHICRKHKHIVELFNYLGRTNRGFFYCYDDKTWSLPLTEAYQTVRRRIMTGRGGT